MKKTMLALGLFIFIGTANAAKYENILMSHSMEQCVSSMQLEFSHLTARIAEDEERASGTSYFINPLRNVDRAIAMQGGDVPCLARYTRFRDNLLLDINRGVAVPVYGHSPRRMNYFSKLSQYFYGGVK